MGDWLKDIIGDELAIPPVGGIGGTFEVPPLSVDLSGDGGLLDSVPPLLTGSTAGGSLVDSLPPVGEAVEIPSAMPTQSIAYPERPSGAPLPPPRAEVPVRSEAQREGASDWRPASHGGVREPGVLAAPKPVERHSEITKAPEALAAAKPLERRSEAVATPHSLRDAKPLERRSEAVSAPHALSDAKPLERHAQPLSAPKPVVRHAEAASHRTDHRHRQGTPAGQPAEVDVLLISRGRNKDEVVQVVKRLLRTKTKTARKWVKRAPVTLLNDVPYADGERAVQLLREAGADAELNWEGEPEGGGVDVVLHQVGSRKISVIKIVRDLTGLGLAEAKTLVDNAPVHVARGVSVDRARQIVRQLRDVGAKVEALE